MTEPKIADHLRVRGCPACHYLELRIAEHFAEIQGSLSRSEDARAGYAGEGGFCPLHTWQLAQFSSPRGIARGHAAFLRTLADRLARLCETGVVGEVSSVLQNGPDGCRVCRFLKDEEARYIGAFHAFLEREENFESYMCSHGLCLRHLSQVVDGPLEDARKIRLVRLVAGRLREIGESMTQYDQKIEKLKRGQLTRDEKDAYRRGLVMLAGERTVFSPFMKGN
jgi:hypothetical protein